MAETDQKNIFGFNPFSEDVPQFEKTATFFFPVENEQESSASTQGSEEERERSVRFTPEKDKNIRIKMNGKTYMVKLDSSQKKRREKHNFDSPSQTDSRIEALPQIFKSERKRSEKQNLPSINSLCFSESRRTTPTLSKRSQPSTETNSILEISFDNEKSGNILIADQKDQAQNENSHFDSPAKPKGIIVLKKLTSPNYQPSPLQETNLIQKPRSILKLKRNINSFAENNQPTPVGSMSSEGPRTNKYPADFFLPVTDRKEKSKLKLESLSQFSVPVVFPNTTKHINLNQAEPKYLLKNPQLQQQQQQQPYFLHSQRNSFKFQEAASLRGGGEEEYIPKLASSLELKCLSTSARKDLPMLADSKTKYLSEVLDWKKKPSSKFRPQEMILDKIFNPSSCRNQRSQEFSFPKN